MVDDIQTGERNENKEKKGKKTIQKQVDNSPRVDLGTKLNETRIGSQKLSKEQIDILNNLRKRNRNVTRR